MESAAVFPTAHILVIEDDYLVARTIERTLHSEPQGAFRVSLASRGDKGLYLARQNPPDLVILDIIMPDVDGYAVCRQMRSDPQLAHIPILFLTAKVKTQDKIAGFNAGADDYLCKPFNIRELICRVQAILRRTRPTPSPAAMEASSGKDSLPQEDCDRFSLDLSGGLSQGVTRDMAPVQDAFSTAAPPHCLVVADFVLDTHTFELRTPQRGTVRLTPLQFDLLYHLMTHPGETFSPARLLDEVWDYPTGKGSPDLVRVHIKTLRQRIENDPLSPAFICTVPGRGYMVSVAAAQGPGYSPPRLASKPVS